MMLLLAAPAQAHHRATKSAVSSALTIAQAYWHSATACPGGTYQGTQVVDLPTTPAKTVFATGADGALTCRILLARRYFGPGRALRTAFACKVVVHEWGHLTGFTEPGGPYGGHHSWDPNNVMFDRWSATNIPPACVKLERDHSLDPQSVRRS